MVCGNCGATYSETDLNCPFCGGENKNEAERKHLLKLEEYDREAEEIKLIPDKIVKKSTNVLLVLGGCAVGCAIVGLMLVFMIGRLSASQGYKTLQSSLEQLESYYQSASYLDMREYIAKEDLYGSSYDKYIETADAYYDYSQMCEGIEEFGNKFTEENGDILVSSIESVLQYGADALSGSKSGMEDKGILGNEDVLTNIYEDTVEKLKGSLGLTDGEIGELATDGEGKTKRIEDLAKKLKEKNL